MEKQYSITGMTCGGCVVKVKKTLEAVNGVQSAHIQLNAPQGTLSLEREIPIALIKERLSQIGNYTIEEIRPSSTKEIELPEKSIATYKPLILIVVFIAGVSVLEQYPFGGFSGMLWMRHFMAGFFLVFSFFKLLNLEGFATSYQMYDIIATKWKGWGFVYPFVELSLGILYLLNVAPFETNLTTVIILGVSTIGVIKSNLDREKIKCACLGDVFNLPMSTVTIIEDLAMVAMAMGMLLIM